MHLIENSMKYENSALCFSLTHPHTANFTLFSARSLNLDCEHSSFRDNHLCVCLCVCRGVIYLPSAVSCWLSSHPSLACFVHQRGCPTPRLPLPRPLMCVQKCRWESENMRQPASDGSMSVYCMSGGNSLKAGVQRDICDGYEAHLPFWKQPAKGHLRWARDHWRSFMQSENVFFFKMYNKQEKRVIIKTSQMKKIMSGLHLALSLYPWTSEPYPPCSENKFMAYNPVACWLEVPTSGLDTIEGGTIWLIISAHQTVHLK